MDCPHRGDQNDGHVAKTVLEWKPQGKGQQGVPDEYGGMQGC